MRLGKGLVRAAGSQEILAQAGFVEHLVQPSPTFSGSHRQQIALIAQLSDYLTGPRKELRFGFALFQKMITISFDHLANKRFFLLGKERCYRLGKSQADDVPYRFPIRNINGHVRRCGLHAGNDSSLRIHQRAVPIENQQFKTIHFAVLPTTSLNQHPAVPGRKYPVCHLAS